MSASRWLLVPAAASLALAMACGHAPESSSDEPEPHVKIQRVYGGQVSGEENDAVVHLTSGPPGGERYCSGTVVAPRMVITARHCIGPYVEGSYQCSTEGGYNTTVPRSPRDAGAVGQAYPPEQVAFRMHQFPFDQEPAYAEKIYTVATDTICRNDIALVRVDRDMPVAPRAMRLTEPTLPGELVTVVGYGRTDTDVPGRHERHDVEILAVGKSTIYPQGRGTYDRTIRIGQAACPGDSGGPTLADSGAVLGVFSILINDCYTESAQNYYTQLAPYRSFIEDAFEDSGYDVLYEDPPSGSAGASGDSDGSGGSSSGGSEATGGSAGEATTGPRVIPGRRKKDDGCSVGVAGDDRGSWQWSSLLLGLVALRRRSRGPR